MAEQTGSGKWSQLGVPHKGWQCLNIYEVEGNLVICEMCETQEIRNVHVMQHVDYPGTLEVGCICAGHMESDLARASNREKNFKNLIARRRTWLKRSWRISGNGNEYLNVDGYNIVVFEKRDGSWGSCLTHRITGSKTASRGKYESSDAAKIGAFKGLQWLVEKKHKDGAKE